MAGQCVDCGSRSGGCDTCVGRPLRAQLATAVALLKQHHEWHLAQGVDDGELVGLDLAAEYADSSLYEQTAAFLGGLT